MPASNSPQQVKAVSAAAAKEREPVPIPPPAASSSATAATPLALRKPGDDGKSSPPLLGLGNGAAAARGETNGSRVSVSCAGSHADAGDEDNAVDAVELIAVTGEANAETGGANGEPCGNGEVAEVETVANGDRQKPAIPLPLPPLPSQQQQQQCTTRSIAYSKASISCRTVAATRASTMAARDLPSYPSAPPPPSNAAQEKLSLPLPPPPSSGDHHSDGPRSPEEPSASSDEAGLGVPLPPPTFPAVSLDAARLAAVRMRETFGLSLFGFDIIVDGTSGELMVIDVNYFPSFKDLDNFPQVERVYSLFFSFFSL